MRTGPVRRRTPRRAAAVILATATLSMVLVAVTGTPSSAEPVNTNINISCGARGGDAETLTALNLARTAGVISGNRIGLQLRATASDIPASAGLEETINARFNFNATLDQGLIDAGAALIPQIVVSNAQGTMLVNGPSSVPSFSASPPPTTVRPQAGQPANVNLGTFGGPIETTGGGIITYRVGSLQFDAAMTVTGFDTFNLKLQCTVQGSNLIARTTVRDPDAPTFEPEVLNINAAPGETISVDLFGDIIQDGKTPLMRDTLEIVEQPTSGQASLGPDGVLSYAAPTEPGTYSITVQVCGEPKPEDEGIPGVNAVQTFMFGDNWSRSGTLFAPRPIAFSLKVGEEETGLIWATNQGLLGTPTPSNWNGGANPLVNQYALFTTYRNPSVNDVTRALEALPSIGAGNVEVEQIRDERDRVVGFNVTYVNDRAEQPIPPMTLGQWYSVPPQEVLDEVEAAIVGLINELGDDDDGESAPNPLEGLSPAQADKFIGDKILASITGGPPVTDEEWSGWLQIRLIDPLIGAAPAIIEFINGLFPARIDPQTTTEGEEPTPPQALCAQGIIDVTVAEVEGETEGPGGEGGPGGTGDGTEVGGIQQTNGGGAGIGFVG